MQGVQSGGMLESLVATVTAKGVEARAVKLIPTLAMTRLTSVISFSVTS